MDTVPGEAVVVGETLPLPDFAELLVFPGGVGKGGVFPGRAGGVGAGECGIIAGDELSCLQNDIAFVLAEDGGKEEDKQWQQEGPHKYDF